MFCLLGTTFRASRNCMLGGDFSFSSSSFSPPSCRLLLSTRDKDQANRHTHTRTHAGGQEDAVCY